MHHKDFNETLQKKLFGTIVHRVFYVLLLFVVLPLLIHTLILYKYQYDNQIDNTYKFLNIIAQDEALFFQHTLEKQTYILEIEVDNIYDRDTKPSESTLKEIKKLTGAKDFFYCIKNNDELFVDSSTDETLLNKKFSDKDPLYGAFKEKSSFIADQKEPLFYLTYALDKKTPGIPESLLVGVFSFKDYIFQIKRKMDFPYSLDISILSKDLKFLESTNPDFLSSKNKMEITKDTHLHNEYLLNVDGEEHLAAEVKIPKTSYIFFLNIAKEDVLLTLKKNFYTHLVLFLFSVVVIGGFLVYLAIGFLSKPINKLLKTIQEVSQGRFHERYVHQKFGFEINLIGQACNNMVEEILKQTEEIENHKLARLLLAQEMHLGHLVQNELMPKKEDLKSSFLEMAALYLPAKEVGGDFYDYFPLDKERALVVIADTSGKGISACLYSLIVRSLLRAFAEKSSNLQEIIENTNNLFCQDTEKSSFFVTSWIGIVDRKQKKLIYSSAGHFPAILKRNNSLIELEVQNLAMGVQPQEKYEIKEMNLEPNDILFLYSDGVIEMENSNKKFWGKANLKQYLNEVKSDHPLSMIEDLGKMLQDFSSGTPQHDDTTAFIIKSLF